MGDLTIGRPVINKSNKRYGKLIILDRTKNDNNGRVMWNCICDCGNTTIVASRHLNENGTKSCGKCPDRDITTYPGYKHGMKGTRLYQIWRGIIDRCENPSVECYKDYGGRGISICAEWRDNFEIFHSWAIKNGYDNTLSIDRFPNNNGNYEPSNCRWATTEEQSNNKRNSVIIEFNGKSQTVMQWAKELKLSPHTLYSRLRKGLNPEDILRIKNDGSTFDISKSKCQSTNQVGIRGVGKCRNGKFRARIYKNGKIVNLGTFDTIDDAIIARKNAEKIKNVE